MTTIVLAHPAEQRARYQVFAVYFRMAYDALCEQHADKRAVRE
jgi:hypothetical protein